MRQLFLVFLLFYLTNASNAFNIRVGLFSAEKPSSIAITSANGSYNVFGDGNRILANDPALLLILSFSNNKVEMKNGGALIGTFATVTISSTDSSNTVRIKSFYPSSELMTVDGDLQITCSQKSLRIVNLANLENYIEGVLESESGTALFPEYFKAHAIMSRTYAIKHLDRHLTEGFDVCDNVHCQMYRGKLRFQSVIPRAVAETRGKVLVDASGQLILSAYHSNCGGQTLNSEQVWSGSLPYLRSVKDSFCLQQPHAAWYHKIAVKDWNKYFMQKNNMQPFPDSIVRTNYKYAPSVRETTFSYKGIQLPIKTLRSELKLKSTYFTIHEKEDSLHIYGRGYGHGVGLCQEGAMKMAMIGRSYGYILNYYFKNIFITQLDNIKL